MDLSQYEIYYGKNICTKEFFLQNITQFQIDFINKSSEQINIFEFDRPCGKFFLHRKAKPCE